MKRLAALLAALALASTAIAADKPAPRAKAKPARAIADVDRDGDPNLKSTAALVLDANTGETLFAKNADAVHPIASITKLMTAMVVLDAKLPLDEPVQISTEDLDLLKGTKSRLPVGAHFRRDDLIRIALVASDNRAAAALGRAYPGGIEAFVEAMNAKARLMGLDSTRFVDSSGLAPGNVSSPAELARLVAEASKYEIIREYSTTPALDVTLPDTGRKVNYVNTNALVRAGDWKIGVSKTGYISESGKCLVMQALIANTPVVIVLLDSWGRLTRIGDANRIKRWLEKNPARLAGALRAG
ncbi:MAG TPA: serine hydrolase [Usitatibacteraceae bacterium]|jgi:D-alanyl-D-alanine endopeptidase (penicillin-binding protein 7)|nr:serine hydrolase [Burkholderiales bacterium]HQW37888.1 serine hydrolase [Usitatibacteraceae bacterium]HRA24260.1 serine hydrolase [Usitatibacteraceae bacterium]